MSDCNRLFNDRRRIMLRDHASDRPSCSNQVVLEEVVRNKLSRYCRDESGATAIEYALIAGSIGLVIITAAQLIGVSLVDVFTNVSNGFPA